MTSPENTFFSPLYGYYEALAQLALLEGDLSLSILSNNAEKAAENLIDIDGTTDPSNNVQTGLRQAIKKLGYSIMPLSRRDVGERDAEVKMFEADIRAMEISLKLGEVEPEAVPAVRAGIKAMQEQLPAMQQAQLVYASTPLARLLSSADKKVHKIVDDAQAVVAEKIIAKLRKKNPQRSFR